VRFLFTVAIFLNALLLFSVQPMIAKALLPVFGGTPTVWLVSMVFFQFALLAGYGYGHFLGKLGKFQVFGHVGLLAVSALTLPFKPNTQALENMDPALRLIAVLAMAVGPTFVLVSSGAPLMQRWFAATDDPLASRPYFLYSASNLGSMVALLSYPFFIEPRLRISEQYGGWMTGFIILCAAVLLVGGLAFKRWQTPTETAETEEDDAPPTTNDRLRWIALSAVPSALLLGVTNFLTANVAPVPLLWVIPLALYLLTFTLAFARRTIANSTLLGRLVPLVAIPLAIPIALESTDHERIVQLCLFHLGVFFIATWMCHSRLAESAPAGKRATEFYFFLALGGVIGGAMTALVSPLVFNTYFEYPLALALAVLLRPKPASDKPQPDNNLPLITTIASVAAIYIYCAYIRGVSIPLASIPEKYHQGIGVMLTIGLPLIAVFLMSNKPVRQGLALIALFLGYQHGTLNNPSDGITVLRQERSFFGVLKVTQTGNKGVSLIHGTTLHGRQNLEKLDLPITYYFPTGPIGQIFADRTPKKVALVGMGVGTLAAYGKPGMDMTFYEIDPLVLELASNPGLFSFLKDSKANIKTVIGDGRQKLEQSPDKYDVIVLDAFSSDAIPAHLITRQAIRAYENHLAPGGIICFHISNRYLALENIIAQGAKEEGLVSYYQMDVAITDEERLDGKTASTWIMVTRKPEDFGKMQKDSRWELFTPRPDARAWTDDYSNLWQAFQEKNADR
jgi:spermidine synthase